MAKLLTSLGGIVPALRGGAMAVGGIVPALRGGAMAVLLLSTLAAAHACGAHAGAQGLAGDGKQDTAPAPKKPSEPAKTPAIKAGPSCSLLTAEGPRGGRLEVEGRGFGKAPLVRIASKVTRMIERTETRIAVQIPRDSDGGPVTVKVGELEIACGTLTIIGKN